VICEFGPAARREFLEAVQWYLADGSQAVAEQFEAAVQRALLVLGLMPHAGTPGYEGVRLWPLKRFPYTLIYRVRGELVTVVAMAHQRREPTYWRGR
jgi:toxin ParE1/3/4